QLGELSELIIKKERKPDTFAAAFLPDFIHAIVPIAGADQRQTVFAEFQAVLDRANAMLVQRCCLLRTAWHIIIRFFLRHDRPRCEERNFFIEHASIGGSRHVAKCYVGQPEIIVGTMGTHASAAWRMPPMLDVAFDELMSGSAQKMFACDRRFGMHQRHHVLQLVAKSVSAAALIKAGAPPIAATEGLI